MTKETFIELYLTNVKIPIKNKDESCQVQRIMFECGFTWFNGYDKIIERGGVDNLCTYSGNKFRESGFFGLEDKKFIDFKEFVESWECVV